MIKAIKANRIIYLLILFTLISFFNVNAKIKEGKINNQLLEERIKNNEEKSNIEIQNLKNKIESNDNYLKEYIDKTDSDLKERMLLYVTFVLGILILLGFLLNFFGKKALKERVEQIIKTTVTKIVTKVYIENIIKNHIEILKSEIESNIEKSIIETKDKIISRLESSATNYIDELSKRKIDISKIDEESQDIRNKLNELAQNINERQALGKILSAEDYYFKGYEYFDKKDYENAIKQWEKAIELKQNYYEAWNNKGVAFDILEKYEEAIKSYDEAIKIKQDFYLAWNNKGSALSKLEKYEEAIKSYDEAIKIKQDYYEAWNNKGVTFGKLEKYEEAIKSYDEAIKIKQDFYLAWNNKSVALNKLGKYDDARICFEKLYEMQSKNISNLENLIESLIFCKQYNQAIEKIDNSLTLEINEKDKLILFYLKIIAKSLLYQNSDYEQKLFVDILNNLTIEITWNTKDFENWLNKEQIPQNIKSFLQELTFKLNTKKKK
ncbi:MAG: tetratricopeptide repeat protein [Ignavibacteriae bacterium]|nr:tetratricopeptide repeat protein [Ignavibacteriota bacterium]